MRRKGSKDRHKRAKARTPYQTYSDWYDKFTKGEKAKFFDRKLTADEFDKQYNKARMAKVPNPAMQIAREQGIKHPGQMRNWESKLTEVYGSVPDLRDAEARRIWFVDFYDQMRMEGMTDHDAIEREFQSLFY